MTTRELVVCTPTSGRWRMRAASSPSPSPVTPATSTNSTLLELIPDADPQRQRRPTGWAPYALSMLYGRGKGTVVFDRLVGNARRQVSGAALVTGEAGVGKTDLLRYAEDRASGLTVLRATGTQAESKIPYATLHQLLRSVVDRTDARPVAQADALNAALGLADARRHPDRQLVASGVLSLLGEVGGAGGVLCVVDDLHWADRASFDALMFTVRRLSAEGVTMLFAARAQADWQTEIPPEITVVDVANLTVDATRALLTAVSRALPIRCFHAQPSGAKAIYVRSRCVPHRTYNCIRKPTWLVVIRWGSVTGSVFRRFS